MDNNSDIKVLQNRIEKLLIDENISLIDYSHNDNDKYITINYNNNSFTNKLYNLLEKEYVFTFKKEDDEITMTISGDDNIFNDLLEINTYEEKEYNDIRELIIFLNKTDNVEASIYFNGVYYNYSITENEYGFALEYYNFIFDGIHYRYQTKNNNILYENFKEINKHINAYKSLISPIKKIDNCEVMPSNRFITYIEHVYNKYKKKDIYIVINGQMYSIIIKTEEKNYLYPYTTRLNITNIMPEIINMYLKDSNGTYEEKIDNCLGRCFYSNKLDDNKSLHILNIKEETLNYELDYIEAIAKTLKKDEESNQNVILNFINNNNKNNKGYINIAVLFIFLISIILITFMFTLLFINKM